jgi:fused signal recognition particle receptor
MLKFFSKSKQNSDSNSATKISTAIKQIFTHRELNSDMIEKFEEQLIIADIGIKASQEIIQTLKQQKFIKNITFEQVRTFLSGEIYNMLQPFQKNLEMKNKKKPQIIVFNGVNGSGKTTTIGKIAANLSAQGSKVLIAACDSFRAAAPQQLKIWSQRANCEIILPSKENEDPAAIAYRASKYAKENNFDILLIDTAGRLQNRQNLMDELKKIGKVIKKIDEDAPHENILVVDSTTGQNSYNQLKIFDELVGISGLIITKLDSGAKGGMLIPLVQEFKKPIYAIGVGEKIEDLQEFNARNFANNLLACND